jgi:glycosyltransferase involved in cell wall biosynthesis
VNRIIVGFGPGWDRATFSIHNIVDGVFISRGGTVNARVEGIKHVETDYFVMVDDDVILADDWIEQMWKYSHKINALSGVVPFNERHAKIFKKMTKPILRTTGGARTSNVLMHKNWFRNLRVPEMHGVDENVWFMNYLQNGAIAYYTVPVLSSHSKDLPVTPVKTGIRMAARWRRMGRYKNWLQMLKHITRNLAGAFKASFKTRDCYYIVKMTKNTIGYFIGFGLWHEYYKKYDYSCKF